MIEGVVFTALKSLVGNRCYPNTFIQPEDGALPTWPAIRYTLISGDNAFDLCGTDNVDTDDTVVQLDLVAKTHGAVVTLRDQAITAMQGLTPPAVRLSMFNEYDETTKTYRITMDYLFSASSSGGSP